MMLGSAIAPAAAVPARHTLGSWQASLASWAVPAAVAAAAWWPVARRLNRPESVRRSGPARLPWRSRSAWLLAAFMSAQSTLAYGYLAWLAPAHESRGWSPITTGTLLGTLQLGVDCLSGRNRRTALVEAHAALAARSGRSCPAGRSVLKV